MKTRTWTALPLLAAIVASGPAQAGLEIGWWTMDAGGSHYSAAEQLELTATVGQAETTVLSGGDFEIGGGFWYPIGSGESSDIPSLEATPPSFQLYVPMPNPSNGPALLTLDLPRSGHVQVEVFGIDGVRLATLLDTDAPAGRIRFHWDGLREDGSDLPAGIYLLQARTSTERTSQRVIRIH